MAKGAGISMKLPSVDNLFTTQEQRDEEKREKVRDIDITEISDFPNHPFKVKTDEKMLEMVDSIKEYGVLIPALVRPKSEGGYEMVAGHRRKMASELAGKEIMPCLVRNLTDDEAVVIMVDSNLQREEVLPSEKAFAYKMKLEAMKRQAGRPSKENLSPVATNLRGQRSDEILGKQVGESKDQIRRYIRLTELIPSILDMVDEGKIAMRPAVELSYLSKEQQEQLFDTIEKCSLNPDVILSIMTEEKPNQAEQFKMPKKRIEKYFPKGTPSKKMEETIIRALELLRKREREKDRNQGR